MIDVKQVVTELDAIVEEYGADTSYIQRIEAICGEESEEAEKVRWGTDDGCQYTVHGQPACIIGVWLDKQGIRVPEDSHWNTTAWSVYPEGVAKEFGAPEMTQKASNFLRVVQRHQDVGASWGEALDRAKADV